MRTGLISIVIAAALPSLAAAQEMAPAQPLQSAPEKPAPEKTGPAKPAPGKPAHTVGEVVVTGEAAVAVQTSIDRKSYDVTKDLQAQSGAIADALRNLPSVQVDPQGNISLRGDPNVTILIDGKPSSLFQGDNKAQALQSLPADSIARVEVITNPSAEFQTDGSAGIINLITKHSRGVGLTGSMRGTVGDGQRANTGASLGYNSDKLTVSMTGELAIRQDTQKQKWCRRSADPRSRRRLRRRRPAADPALPGGVGERPRRRRLRSHAEDAHRPGNARQLHGLPADRPAP